MSIGSHVLDAIPRGCSQVKIVSAYIRSEALARVLRFIPQDADVEVFVRWNTGDIISGASDVAAWDLVAERHGASLRVCPALHAKYYRFDREVWCGSANMTMRGFGWSASPNIEVLERIAWDDAWLDWEDFLRRSSWPVTQEMVDELLALEVKEARLEASASRRAVADDCWLPCSRDPERVIEYLRGKPLMAELEIQAMKDLESLGLAGDVSVYVFRRRVLEAMSSSLIFAAVERLARVPGGSRFGTVRSAIAAIMGDYGGGVTASEATQLAYRWLLAFRGDVYQVVEADYSEIIRVRWL